MKQARGTKHDVSSDATSITDIRDLRTLCLTVDLRSLTAVARLTGESKPTVSRRITRLERALGVQLLRRNPRRVEPTEEGSLYRQRLAQILELLEDANSIAQRTQATPRGHLRITAPPEFGALLAPVLVGFAERYPDVTVETLMAQQRLDLDADQLDVALRFSFGLDDSALVAHRLLDLEIVFVASPAYLRRHGHPTRSLADLDAHRVIILTLARPAARSAARTTKGWRAFEAVTARLRPSLSSSDMNFVRELALADGGVAFLPSICVAHELGDGRLVQVVQSHVGMPAAALYLVHASARVLPPKVRAFRAHMLAAFSAPGRAGSAGKRQRSDAEVKTGR
jgi:DNA-binding transcriptional LysR family regulator